LLDAVSRASIWDSKRTDAKKFPSRFPIAADNLGNRIEGKPAAFAFRDGFDDRRFIYSTMLAVQDLRRFLRLFEVLTTGAQALTKYGRAKSRSRKNSQGRHYVRAAAGAPRRALTISFFHSRPARAGEDFSRLQQSCVRWACRRSKQRRGPVGWSAGRSCRPPYQSRNRGRVLFNDEIHRLKSRSADVRSIRTMKIINRYHGLPKAGPRAQSSCRSALYLDRSPRPLWPFDAPLANRFGHIIELGISSDRQKTNPGALRSIDTQTLPPRFLGLREEATVSRRSPAVSRGTPASPPTAAPGARNIRSVKGRHDHQRLPNESLLMRRQV